MRYLLLCAGLLLLCGAAPAHAAIVPGTQTNHILGIQNTKSTPGWKRVINNHIRTHKGAARWRPIFEHYRQWQLDCKRAGKGGGYVWRWGWGKPIMHRESHFQWNAYNTAFPYAAGTWQLACVHRQVEGWSLIESVYVWRHWYKAAQLYRDSGPWHWRL